METGGCLTGIMGREVQMGHGYIWMMILRCMMVWLSKRIKLYLTLVFPTDNT